MADIFDEIDIQTNTGDVFDTISTSGDNSNDVLRQFKRYPQIYEQQTSQALGNINRAFQQPTLSNIGQGILSTIGLPFTPLTAATRAFVGEPTEQLGQTAYRATSGDQQVPENVKNISRLGANVAETALLAAPLMESIASRIAPIPKGLEISQKMGINPKSVGRGSETVTPEGTTGIAKTTEQPSEMNLEQLRKLKSQYETLFAEKPATNVEGQLAQKMAMQNVDDAIRQTELSGQTAGQTAQAKTPVQTVIDALQSAKALTKEQKALYATERGKRIQSAIEAGQTAGGGEAGYYSELSKLKGALPKVEFETIRNKISQADVDDLFNQVSNSQNLTDFEKIAAKNGLLKLFGVEGGYMPNPGEIAKLSKVFPKEFIDTVASKEPRIGRFARMVGEVINLPRAVMASTDLSAPLRQGLFLVGKPKQFIPAFRDMFKYAFSEKAYQGLNENIASRATYPLMKDSGLAITDISNPLLGREERFMSNLAEKIPVFGRVVRGSDRAYTGFINKLRADVFDDLINKANSLGITQRNPVVANDISRFVNSATGRGDLGELNKASVIINGIFFSPKLMKSRLDLLNPVFYTKLDPFVRKEALKSLMTVAGAGMGILGLAKMGGADVGIDPTSADFGKIKIGNTRYDPWGGFQQYFVLGSRLLTNKMTSSVTGREYELGQGYRPTTRKDIIMRFLESKENPVLSFVTNLLASENNPNNKFNIPAETINRFIPMMASDIYDLYKEKGIFGTPMAIPGTFGVGLQTYGEQAPTFDRTPSGRRKIQWLNSPSIGESLTNMIGGNERSNIPSAYWDAYRQRRKNELEKQIRQEERKRYLGGY